MSEKRKKVCRTLITLNIDVSWCVSVSKLKIQIIVLVKNLLMIIIVLLLTKLRQMLNPAGKHWSPGRLEDNLLQCLQTFSKVSISPSRERPDMTSWWRSCLTSQGQLESTSQERFLGGVLRTFFGGPSEDVLGTMWEHLYSYTMILNL